MARPARARRWVSLAGMWLQPLQTSISKVDLATTPNGTAMRLGARLNLPVASGPTMPLHPA